MLKRILVLLLCAAMLLSTASAESPVFESEETAAWRLVVDDVEFTRQGETVHLNPWLELLLVREYNGYRAQLSVMLEDEPILSLWGETADNALCFTVSGAQDALLIGDVDLFLQQYSLTAAELNSLLSFIYDLLRCTTDELPGVAEGYFPGITLLGDREFDYTLEIAYGTLSAHFLWEFHADSVPFLLPDKNVCRYTFRETFPGEGTDIPETLAAQLALLSAEPSVLRFAEAFAALSTDLMIPMDIS